MSRFIGPRGLALEVEGTFSAATVIDKSLIDYCAPTTDGDVGRNVDDDDLSAAAPEDDGWAAPTPAPTVFPTYAPTAPTPAPSPAGPRLAPEDDAAPQGDDVPPPGESGALQGDDVASPGEAGVPRGDDDAPLPGESAGIPARARTK